jgi:hypothetical protein
MAGRSARLEMRLPKMARPCNTAVLLVLACVGPARAFLGAFAPSQLCRAAGRLGTAHCRSTHRSFVPSSLSGTSPGQAGVPQTRLPGMKQVLFIESGFGADQHGQNATKAAVRACRNAIEFNSIPSISALLPGMFCGVWVWVCGCVRVGVWAWV